MRREDARHLRGKGRYTSDLDAPDALQAYIVRSPHAHAALGRIVVDEAAGSDGVAAVLTGRDLVSAGIGALPCWAEIETSDGAPLHAPEWRLLAADTVRYAGDGVAMVVAESIDAARDAAEKIEIDYRPLPAKMDLDDPAARCFDWEAGDAAATRAAFDGAARVTTLSLTNNRVIVNPLETRSALGFYDSGSGRYTLHTPCQGVHLVRSMLAGPVLGVPPERLRVRTPDVGGGFGMKFAVYPEQGLVLFAARALGRPVRWVADRGEAFLADAHARDHRSRAQLALDAQGRMLALRISTRANLGAYLTGYGPSTATHGYAKLLGHVYRIPAAHLEVRAVLTHSAPVEAYRGAGTPEMVYLVERLVELAARESGIDPIALRRLNLVAAGEMPYTNPNGRTCRDCDFPRLLEHALRRSGWASFSARREEARARGRRRGIGLSFYLHGTAAEGREHVEVRLDASGDVEVRCGTQDSGQGHATSFARLLADRLGIDPERVRVRQGDSDWLPGAPAPAALRPWCWEAPPSSGRRRSFSTVPAGRPQGISRRPRPTSSTRPASSASRERTGRCLSSSSRSPCPRAPMVARGGRVPPMRTRPFPPACSWRKWRWTPRRGGWRSSPSAPPTTSARCTTMPSRAARSMAARLRE